MYLLLFNITKTIIKSISITHPLYFDFEVTNNPPCVFCLHIIVLTIRGQFLKKVMIALNRVENNRAIFEVRSPIKINKTPSLRLGKSLTLTGYSSVLT